MFQIYDAFYAIFLKKLIGISGRSNSFDMSVSHSVQFTVLRVNGSP
jgi:hypothetical protein